MFTNINHVVDHHYHDFLSYDNVVGIGSGYKITDNQITESPAITIFVTKKQSPDELTPDQILPCCYNGSITDVVEIGEIFASGYTSRIRPMQFGYSVGIKGVNSAGTAGCLVAAKNDPNLRYILSNNHVLANVNSAPIGSPILQPSRIDGGLPTDIVANLTGYVPIAFRTPTTSPRNTVDCALARLTSPSIATPIIAAIGIPTGTAPAVLNKAVKKSGRTTGFTTGVIISTNATVSVDYGNGRIAIFTNQIVSTAMSAPGDSGSLLLDANNKAIGLLFAGSTSATIYNPIDLVLNTLKVNLVTS